MAADVVHASAAGVITQSVASSSQVDGNLSVPAGDRNKRFLDVSLATLLLLIAAPVLMMIALAVVLESGGPIFFSQTRTGLGGRRFRIYKFRTMTVAEDGGFVSQAERNDRRVTPLGAVLRKASADELPQLINVIKGDMSLVGPRPHALAHDAEFGALVPDYDKRFAARPGITGLAQVSGYRGEIRNLESLAKRIEHDVHYIETWSLTQDLTILWRTLFVGSFHTNAY